MATQRDRVIAALRAGVTDREKLQRASGASLATLQTLLWQMKKEGLVRFDRGGPVVLAASAAEAEPAPEHAAETPAEPAPAPVPVPRDEPRGREGARGIIADMRAVLREFSAAKLELFELHQELGAVLGVPAATAHVAPAPPTKAEKPSPLAAATKTSRKAAPKPKAQAVEHDDEDYVDVEDADGERLYTCTVLAEAVRFAKKHGGARVVDHDGTVLWGADRDDDDDDDDDQEDEDEDDSDDELDEEAS